MLNRVLIRIKILQILYAFYQSGDNNLQAAENETLFSLRKSYDLYMLFLNLIVRVTNLQERLIDKRRNKYQPTPEDLSPNMKFVNNRFARQLSGNKELLRYMREQKISWDNDESFLDDVLALVLKSQEYEAYMSNAEESYEEDKNLWRDIFKQYICENEELADYLEGCSIYWNDDIAIVASYTLKTIKQFSESEGVHQELLPMFKDQEYHLFAVQLLRKSIFNCTEYREMIRRHARNWENERISTTDIIIAQMAIAEILTFPSIPVSVSLNEYIDIARQYSTPKSPQFVNGLLDAIVIELRRENRIMKG
ncbi:MAG: transcription antitermination protein NusB [Tannerellaceae bacterium]|jgi:N utilization substance protein B|nr:transcription antitermination protein NusB [Tannerellaceae bacterium]